MAGEESAVYNGVSTVPGLLLLKTRPLLKGFLFVGGSRLRKTARSASAAGRQCCRWCRHQAIDLLELQVEVLTCWAGTPSQAKSAAKHQSLHPLPRSPIYGSSSVPAQRTHPDWYGTKISSRLVLPSWLENRSLLDKCRYLSCLPEMMLEGS
jgi:hypothetical protein